MTVSEIAKKMIACSDGNLHDINHFLKVYAYAKTIGECEELDPSVLETLEIAALLHDIACPLCREKYGNTNGKDQEREGVLLARDFLRDADLSPACLERILYLIGHHHTLTGIDGLDYQILVEADYLVNADESGYSPEHIRRTQARVFRTKTGNTLLEAIYFPE